MQEYLAKYRQASQEFEDARARMRKELARDAERNRREVLVGLLEVLDNLDRAVDAARTAGTSPDDRAPPGRRHGPPAVPRASSMDSASAGSPPKARHFDPLLHEAVSVVPIDNADDDGRIVGVVRSGYRIGDEVLRPALVAVAKSSQPVD